VQVFEWLKSYGGRYGADQITDSIARNSTNNWGRWTTSSAMYDGSMAMYNNGLWLYGSIKQYAPQVNFQLQAMPLWKGATNGRAGVLNANFWYITAPAKNAAGGWEVLKWITARKESVIPLAQLDTLVPSRKSIAASKEFLDFAPWTKLFAEQVVPKVKPDYIFASAALLNTQLTNALTAVYLGKVGTKDALDEVARVVQSDIDQKKRS
jgi:ABC-type glycerol-3-phosphate transport system substrate-binding protein